MSNQRAKKQRKQAAGMLNATTIERKPVKGVKALARQAAKPEPKPQEPEISPDLDMEWLRDTTVVNAQEVQDLTDKVFASVLERCGWHLNEHGEIEHVGG